MKRFECMCGFRAVHGVFFPAYTLDAALRAGVTGLSAIFPTAASKRFSG